MNLLMAQWISCDHTFKSVCNIGNTRPEDKCWVTQYNSIFCVLNENEEVIHWQFTKSESFEEVKDLFKDIQSKFITDPLKLNASIIVVSGSISYMKSFLKQQ